MLHQIKKLAISPFLVVGRPKKVWPIFNIEKHEFQAVTSYVKCQALLSLFALLKVTPFSNKANIKTKEYRVKRKGYYLYAVTI